MRVFIEIVGIFIFSSIVFCGADVEEIYSWNYVEYEGLPKQENSYVAPDEPYYISGNTNIEGIGYQASTGLFIVTVARTKRGIPSTVNAFCGSDYKKGSNTPKVKGFPNYQINELKAEYFEGKKHSSVSEESEKEAKETKEAKEDKKEEAAAKEKKDVEEAKVVEQEFYVKSGTKSEISKDDQIKKTEEEVIKSDDTEKEQEEEPTLEGKSTKKKEQKPENEETEEAQGAPHNSEDSTRKKGSYYVNKPSTNYDYHNTKPTHGSYTKPQYTHLTSKPHISHTKPDYQSSGSYYYKPQNKPSYSHIATKPHKNKYGSLSQIHIVHSGNSPGYKRVPDIPLPYRVSESEEPTRPEEEFPVKETGNFVSVHHPVIDDVCNRVWFVDTGVLNYQEGRMEVQLPSLWIIDLPRVKCGKGPYNIQRHFKIPKSVVADGSGLRTVALDYTNTGACNDVFAYFPNSFTGEINVYDYKNNKAWSFHDHYSFFPVISTSTYTLQEEEFTDEMGVSSVTLGWRDERSFRTAYYISPTSTVQFGVSTRVLKQEKLAPTNYTLDAFHSIGNRGCGTQSVAHVFDARNGVIFYGDRNGLSLRCWNVRKPPTPDYVDVVYQDENFAFINEIFIDEAGFLWALSNRNPFFFKNSFDTSKVNVRLYRVHVNKAIESTLCANDENEYKEEGIFDYYQTAEDFIVGL